MALSPPPIDRTYQSPNKGGYAGRRVVEAVILHVTVGSASSSLGWLCNPASNASSNYLIDRAGKVYELVPPDESAWTNGAVNQPDMAIPLVREWVSSGRNPNTRTATIELERTQSANNQPGGFTAPQHESCIHLSAWLCERYAIAPTRNTVFGHRSIDSVNRQYCPGLAESEWDQWVGEIATLVGGSPAGGQTVPVPMPGTAASVLLGGVPVSVINWDGQAATIDGTAFVDVGLTCTNAAGERYSRTLKNGIMGPWTRVN